jgi:phosphoribosyl-ATP pyrophosphohydrolase
MTEQEIYKEIVKKNGRNKQLIKAQEESAEFIQAISKYLFNEDTSLIEKVIEEAVDAEIMINQVKAIFPYKEIWDKHKKAKLDRVSKLLE